MSQYMHSLKIGDEIEEQIITFDDEFIFETFNSNSIEKNEIFDIRETPMT